MWGGEGKSPTWKRREHNNYKTVATSKKRASPKYRKKSPALTAGRRGEKYCAIHKKEKKRARPEKMQRGMTKKLWD